MHQNACEYYDYLQFDLSDNDCAVFYMNLNAMSSNNAYVSKNALSQNHLFAYIASVLEQVSVCVAAFLSDPTVTAQVVAAVFTWYISLSRSYFKINGAEQFFLSVHFSANS